MTVTLFKRLDQAERKDMNVLLTQDSVVVLEIAEAKYYVAKIKKKS